MLLLSQSATIIIAAVDFAKLVSKYMVSNVTDSHHPSVNDASGAGFIPHLALDFVIIGFHEQELKILVLEYENTGLFALPGGFIRMHEDLEDAARRVLRERTGLTDLYLQQFHTFGSVQRADPEPMRAIMQGKGFSPQAHHWLLQRFVTVGYYALVDFTKVSPQPDLMADRCDWHDYGRLPILMQDHFEIVQFAMQHLRANLDQELVGFSLLGEAFTMQTLQNLYETILGEKLNRSSFQRRMLQLDLLERLEKRYTGKAHKAPYLYRFKKLGTAHTSL